MNWMYPILLTQSVLLMIILFLLCTVKEPLVKQYEATIHQLCASQELFHTEEDVLARYPELREIKRKIEQAARLHAQCMQAFRVPVISSQEAEIVRIRQKQQKAKQLRAEAKQQLQRFTLTIATH